MLHFTFFNFIKTKQRAHFTPNVAEFQSASIKFLQLIRSSDLKDEIPMLESLNFTLRNSYKNLAPFLDPATKLVRVGDRLTQGEF